MTIASVILHSAIGDQITVTAGWSAWGLIWYRASDGYPDHKTHFSPTPVNLAYLFPPCSGGSNGGGIRAPMMAMGPREAGGFSRKTTPFAFARPVTFPYVRVRAWRVASVPVLGGGQSWYPLASRGFPTPSNSSPQPKSGGQSAGTWPRPRTPDPSEVASTTPVATPVHSAIASSA